MLRRFLGVVLAASLGGAAHSFPTGPGQPPKPTPSSTEFTVKLNDDSQLSVVLLEPNLTVNTRYGKLVIPAGEVRKLEPGFRYPVGEEQRILKAIEALGSEDFKERETAEAALVKFGWTALPNVRRATKSDDPEVVRRAAAVLKKLEAKLPADKLDVRDLDVIETAEFTAKGRIEATQLKVKTKHFGEASLPLADVRSFASLIRGGPVELSLDASQYARTNNTNWMETSVEVSDGQQLDITATGQIDQWPQQPGQYLCSPSGQMTVNGGIQPVRPGVIGAPGQIVGRIGPNGTQFVIGAAYKGRASGTGKLYLRIGGSPWSVDSAGSYSVKVNVGGG